MTAGAAPLACLRWEFRRSAAEREPTFAGRPPDGRLEDIASAAERVLAERGLAVVPFEECERILKVTDDPFYPGEYYEIRVFETLFGMGYPERQR